MRHKERYFLVTGKMEQALKDLYAEYEAAVEKRPEFLKRVGGARFVGAPDVWGVVFHEIPKGNDWVRAANPPEAFRPNPDTPGGQKLLEQFKELNGPDEEEAAARVGAHAVYNKNAANQIVPYYPEFALFKDRVVVISPVGFDGDCFIPPESKEITREEYQILKKAAGQMDPSDPDDLVEAITRMNKTPPPQKPQPPGPGTRP